MPCNILCKMNKSDCDVLNQSIFLLSVMLHRIIVCDLFTVVGKRKSIVSANVGKALDENDSKLGLGSKILFGVSATLAIPIAAAAGLALLPISVPAMIAFRVQEVQDQKKYNKQKTKIMAKWTESHLKELLTNENINNYIFMTYFKYLEKQICEICDKRIPAIIESDRMMLQNIQSDQRTSKDIFQDLQPMQLSLGYICNQLCLYDMHYFDEEFNFVNLESVILNSEIGTGQFSTAYRVTLQHKDAPLKEATLKVMKHSNDESEAHDSLNEVVCLR